MAYTISTAFAIYFVLWWVVLFLTLPFGVRSQHEDGAGAPGTDPGAPVLTRMGSKLIWKTLTQLRTVKAFVEQAVFADAVAACEKAQSTTPFKWNGGKQTAVIGLNSVKPSK